MDDMVGRGRVTMQRRFPPAPWRDRAGRLSRLKLVVFVALFAPAIWLVLDLLTNIVDQPITAAIHDTGRWAIYLLLASLAVTPLQRAFKWLALIAVRRMVGVAAFAYAIAHLGGFVVDKSFDLARVGSEIVLRIYLTIGFASLIILAVLAATSTDAMIKRIGQARWQTLHRTAYVATALAIAHEFMQTKQDLFLPTLIAGIAVWLLAFRLVLWTKGGLAAARPIALAAQITTAAIITATGECLYLRMKFGAPWDALLAAQIDLEPPGPRPALLIVAMGVVVVIAALYRQRTA